MTLYTIMPEEVVWAGREEFNPVYLDMEINGVSMQVERLNGAQARVVRLYSSNVQDYLNPAYAPGSILEFQPCFRRTEALNNFSMPSSAAGDARAL